MNLDQIDATLADLRARSRRISNALLDLEQAVTYQRLVGQGGWPKVALAGDTEARVAPALETLHGVWERFALLNEVLGRATALRNSVSWLLPSQKTLDAIENLLCGPSIELSPSLRRLAASSPGALSPGELLEDMTRSFELASETVLAVDAAWDRLLPALVGFDDQTAAIQKLADSLDEPAPAELVEARRKIALLREAIEHDPLAADVQSQAVAPLLEAARARLDDLAQRRDRASGMLAEARRLHDTLKEAHRRAQQSHAEREAKVRTDDASAPFPGPLDDAQVAALRPWIEKLDNTLREGKWKPALVGLEKWSAIARQYLTVEEVTHEANDAALRARRDLRGLLDALQAKARGNGRAEDIELDALAQKARQLLHSRPTPLGEARRLVAEYQSRLL
jgi:hypothetical protein